MPNQAYLGTQSKLQLGDAGSPEGFTDIGGVVSIDPIARKKDLVEVTDLASTGKEFIGGLSDGQEINFVCNYVPTDPNIVLLRTAAGTASAAKNFRYLIPATAAGGAKMFTFAAVVLADSLGPTTPNTAVQITFGIKITGAVTGPIAIT